MATDSLLMTDRIITCSDELDAFIKSVRFNNPTAVTLTMKKRAGGLSADQIIASQNFQHFRNRLNHTVLGSRAKRYGARLQMIVVLETSADHRLHFHCMIDRPCGCSFTEFAAIIREQLGKSIRLFSERFRSLIQLPLGWPTPRNLKQRRITRALNSIIYRYIEQRRREPLEGRTDLLSRLLHARDVEGDGGSMTDAQLRDELMTLFLAGQETTAIALTWTWYLLCEHPEVDARLADELRRELGDRPLTVDDVPKLKFAEAVVLESMRLYPPAYLLGREAVRDVTIAGRVLKKGLTVFMAQWVTQRDPRWWPDPEQFRPERWLDGSTENLPKYAYFPFGGGPRICIGNTFAMMETVVVLAEIARRFRLQRLSFEPLTPVPSITLRPDKPLDVELRARD
jgi:cytochrome P450